jgi:hypothetical protein
MWFRTLRVIFLAMPLALTMGACAVSAPPGYAYGGGYAYPPAYYYGPPSYGPPAFGSVDLLFGGWGGGWQHRHHWRDGDRFHWQHDGHAWHGGGPHGAHGGHR